MSAHFCLVVTYMESGVARPGANQMLFCLGRGSKPAILDLYGNPEMRIKRYKKNTAKEQNLFLKPREISLLLLLVGNALACRRDVIQSPTPEENRRHLRAHRLLLYGSAHILCPVTYFILHCCYPGRRVG